MTPLQYKLQVCDGSIANISDEPTIIWYSTASTQSKFLAGVSSGSGVFYIHDMVAGTSPFQIAKGAPSNALYISNAGKVGMGTSTPRSSLEVNGQIITSGASGILVTDRSNDAKAFEWYNLDGRMRLYVSGYNNVDQDKFSIDQNGVVAANRVIVGIGVINPNSGYNNYQLAVNGTIGAKKIIVTQTGWADYVFDSSYKLRSLPEVAAYIKTHKHLPDIPAAAKIEEEGLDMAATQKLMMQKIEELTLYIIEQNRQLQEQQHQIEILKKKMEK